MIEDIKDAKEQLIDYFGGKKELKEATEDKINDAITEIADTACDIYTANILKWVTEDNNYYKVEEAIDEFGYSHDTDGRADFIKTIQQGQYLVNRELLDEARQEL